MWGVHCWARGFEEAGWRFVVLLTLRQGYVEMMVTESKLPKHANEVYTIWAYRLFEEQFTKFLEYCQGLVVYNKGEHVYEMHKRSLKDNLPRSKRLLKTTRLYEDEVIKLKTLKRRRMVRNSFISYVSF
ncbi:hypothetical protein M9H77_20893 [Catharanthus roseus]|uniref:Uncharacterized protein n=1 Tax=Catharanthus roseus TaxID=4058 RepID=A0ACC0AL09_CATRO|nr:hypothetical protein M9H77_20893 [Catharanthus roseus]